MPAFANKLAKERRVELARNLTKKLVDHTRGLIAIAENNNVVLYSDTLSAQIPESYAANAFNELQRSMHFYFLVRLSAIWDKASPDRESIPSVMALIEQADVIDQLAEDTFQYHLNIAEPSNSKPTEDPEERRFLAEAWETYCLERAEEEKAKVKRMIAFVKRVVPRVEQSCIDRSLRPFRNGFIAHNLEDSVVRKGYPVRLRYGDETKLLRLTIRIIDRLHLALNGTGFDWDMAKEHATRNANELWSNCRFEFPQK